MELDLILIDRAALRVIERTKRERAGLVLEPAFVDQEAWDVWRVVFREHLLVNWMEIAKAISSRVEVYIQAASKNSTDSATSL